MVKKGKSAATKKLLDLKSAKIESLYEELHAMKAERAKQQLHLEFRLTTVAATKKLNPKVDIGFLAKKWAILYQRKKVGVLQYSEGGRKTEYKIDHYRLESPPDNLNCSSPWLAARVFNKLVLEYWSSRDVNSQDVSFEEKLFEDLQPHSSLTELHMFNYMGNSFKIFIP
ncbi:hypothetical protein Ddye_025553 [Dipteronia dyeriana]|uniref:Uncharacterized protein n=1 Tax=Dipteronia dyeriana TaxID=168575 RepID=A0AAD9WPL7_9ROSI|nr:hypothetical protein Ddye_025553 [Dipteronia dyeriana]